MSLLLLFSPGRAEEVAEIPGGKIRRARPINHRDDEEATVLAVIVAFLQAIHGH